MIKRIVILENGDRLSSKEMAQCELVLLREGKNYKTIKSRHSKEICNKAKIAKLIFM